MLRARLCRQAQTWGLTYWTVLIPAERRSRARRRLNSGASIPTNTSGLAARNEARMRARRRSRRGRSRTISNKPITAGDSEELGVRRKTAQRVDQIGAQRIA